MKHFGYGNIRKHSTVRLQPFSILFKYKLFSINDFYEFQKKLIVNLVFTPLSNLEVCVYY